MASKLLSQAALGNGVDLSIFFTFWDLDMIRRDRVDHLEIAPVTNTSMKMSMMGRLYQENIQFILSILVNVFGF